MAFCRVRGHKQEGDPEGWLYSKHDCRDVSEQNRKRGSRSEHRRTHPGIRDDRHSWNRRFFRAIPSSLRAASVSQADPAADWTIVRTSEPGIGSIALAHSRTTSRRHARHKLMPSHVEHWRTSPQRVHWDTIGVRMITLQTPSGGRTP